MVVVVVVARACFLGTTLGETFGFGVWAVVWTALGEPGFAPTSGLTPTGGFGFGLGAVGGGPTNDRAQKNRHIVLDGVIKRIPWMGVGVATGTARRDCERMDFRRKCKARENRLRRGRTHLVSVWAWSVVADRLALCELQVTR